jgi:methylthioribose-1-phosphate isomerase
MLETVRWINAEGSILAGSEQDTPLRPGKLRIIDQTRLPQELVYLELDDVDEIYDAIVRLAVRGAPAIGCAAALGLAAAAQHLDAQDPDRFSTEVNRLADRLAASRPTAVNLFWALDRCKTAISHFNRCEKHSIAESKDRLVREGLSILEEDIRMCRTMGRHGAELISDGMGLLTHCNAGALATGDFGTALSPMYTAQAQGRIFTVYSDETRPLLQGSRLTAWELRQAGIDVVTICDSMAAQVMKEGKIDLVIVGSDRIAANGDAANKIGTYALAVLAKHHAIPFYVVAPTSTIDASLSHGGLIPIEQRDASEVRCCGGRATAPEDVRVYNPAFDVTPHELISGIITENGVHRPPFKFN